MLLIDSFNEVIAVEDGVKLKVACPTCQHAAGLQGGIYSTEGRDEEWLNSIRRALQQ